MRCPGCQLGTGLRISCTSFTEWSPSLAWLDSTSRTYPTWGKSLPGNNLFSNDSKCCDLSEDVTYWPNWVCNWAFSIRRKGAPSNALCVLSFLYVKRICLVTEGSTHFSLAIKLDNIKWWGRINEAVAQHVISVGVSVLIMDMRTKTNASINQTGYLIQDISW